MCARVHQIAREAVYVCLSLSVSQSVSQLEVGVPACHLGRLCVCVCLCNSAKKRETS